MSEQIKDRRAKLERIRELGVDPFGSRFTGVAANRDIRAIAERVPIEPGQTLETPEAMVRAAGRVALYRDTGKLIFMTVRDWTGEIQWALSKKAVEEAAEALDRRDDGANQNPDRKGGAQREGSGGGAESGMPEARRGTVPSAEGAASALPTADSSMSASPTPGEAAWTPGAAAWQVAKLLDLGDIVGAEGRLGRTKTGELTLWVSRFRLLSKALRPPPEKWHGLTDIEARYRRRYVDLFSNPASRDVFITRARIVDYIRGVLRARGYIEVETPALQPIYGGAAARPFVTHHNALGMQLYLRISPELYLKRCLVGGLERVYEFSRCFRNEGVSPRHNPEFTMLELYQAYGDYHDMMDITEALIAGAARDIIGTYTIAFEGREIDYTPPWPRRRYADLVRECAGVDIDDRAAVLAKAEEVGILAKLRNAAAAAERAARGVGGGGAPAASAPGISESAPQPTVPAGASPGAFDHVLLVNALFEEFVEPRLLNPTFVIDYPAPLCPLTRRHPDDPNLALRFEVYLNGMEMGNAYSELNDPDIQRANFEGQVEGEGAETMRVMDDDFCEALEYAMPPAGGLGIGIDRLCMLLTGSGSIRDVLLFPLQRNLVEHLASSIGFSDRAQARRAANLDTP